jgi:cytochrome c biogenesis protein CcmG/thiol:disulfide interchange protein DsbE
MRFNRMALASGLAALATVAAPLGAASTGPAKVGRAAPPFTLTTFDKQKVKLEDLRGKVVVLNYWATWCAPCRGEMPMMDRFHRLHQKEGFEIFAVATEGSLPTYLLRRYLKDVSMRLATKMSGKGYGTIGNSVPTSYVIDRSGVVRYAKAGAFDKAEFDSIILPLLKEAAPEA